MSILKISNQLYEHMNSVNYNASFAHDRNIFLELVKLSKNGLYTIDELAELGLKQTQNKKSDIKNSIHLLIESNILCLEESKCRSLVYSEKDIKKSIINYLKSINILEYIEGQIELDIDKKAFINPINLFDKYSGILVLMKYLNLVDYEAGKKLFYLNEYGSSICLRKKKTLHELEIDLSAQKERGIIAENYILNREQARLNKHPLFSEIKKISDYDVGAGYDIESFKSLKSKKIDKFIEVKSFKGKKTFHWSINEINKAEKLLDNYSLVIVDSDKINESSYRPKEITNPYKLFNMEQIKKNHSKLLLPSNIIELHIDSFSFTFTDELCSFDSI